MTQYELNPFTRKMERTSETQKGQLGEVGSSGDLMYFDDINDQWFQASHTSETTCKGMLGILLGSGSSGGTGEFLLNGTFKTTGLNKAATYLVGSTDGSIVADGSSGEPDTEDYVIRVVGYAKSTTELVFDPDDSYYTLGAESDDDTEMMTQTLTDILSTLKIINLHMSLITDVHLRDSEVE